jgi:hypothetical protein
MDQSQDEVACQFWIVCIADIGQRYAPGSRTPYVRNSKGQHPMPKATKESEANPYLATESAVTRPHAPIDNDVPPTLPIYPAHTIITSFPSRLAEQS